jgi:hypothetical protein
MEKSANTAAAIVLPALVLCGAACDVYDASLSRQSERSAKIVDASEEIPDASTDAALDDAGDDLFSASCGNGVVDPTERCDVGIASGRPGACPEGCSGREGCTQRVLVGRQCTARCADLTITQAIPDDGCCPSEATALQDNDCASYCGNGLIERGEHCDPPETCAKKAACVTTETCEQAHYTGDPAQCTAACDVQPIHACLGGDGCCPAGCSQESDSDCHAPDPGCDAGCPMPTGEPSMGATQPDASLECQAAHGVSMCQACDCENCQAEVSNCLNAPGEGAGAKCEALSRCAAQQRCTGLACYCGGLSADACQLYAAGPCVAEIRALAGTRNVFDLISIASTEDSGLGRWTKLMACRRSKCEETCSL